MRRPQIIPQFSVGAPMVPTGLIATAVSSTQINLAWNASSDPGGPGLKDYGVYRQGTGLLGYVTGLSFSNTGLTPSTAYTYYVTARDLNLLESGPSGFATATTQGAGGSGFIPNAALGVTVLSGSFANGQTLSLSVPGGGLIARANPLPLYYYPFGEDGSTNLSTHATLSRTSKTLPPINANTFIQSGVKPVNAAGACQYIPITAAGGSHAPTAFTGNVFTTPGGAGAWTYLWMKRYWAFSVAASNCKLWRLWNAAITHSVMFLTQTPSTEWGCGVDANVLTSGIAHPTFFVGGPLSWPGINQWNTDEWFWRENTPDTYDGIHQWARQAGMAYEMAGRFNVIGATSGFGPGPLVTGYLDEFTPAPSGPTTPNGTTDIGYYGAVVADDSILQAIVTDEGATYQTAYIYTSPTPRNREIQIQTLRSDVRLDIVVRQGSHASMTGKHLLAQTGSGTAIDLGVGA